MDILHDHRQGRVSGNIYQDSSDRVVQLAAVPALIGFQIPCRLRFRDQAGREALNFVLHVRWVTT